MTDIINRPRSEPDWIIPGLLKRQNVLFMIGPPKVGKSWLLLNLGWDLALGEPVWGIERARDGFLFQPSRPMHVLYFAQEDTEDDLQDRLILMRDAGRTPAELFWFMPKDLGLLLDTETGIVSIERVIADAARISPVDLVIFDPFRRVLHGDENSSAVTAALWRQLDAWGQKFGCAFMFSHHTIKPPRDNSKSKKSSGYDPSDPFVGRGSGDIFGGGDAFINVVAGGTHSALAHTHPLKLFFQTKRAAPICPVKVDLEVPPGLVRFDGFIQGRSMSSVGDN